ncbi:MAG: phosphopyruvate hydratase [Candidatus Aenigmatarchaeota archaeon]
MIEGLNGYKIFNSRGEETLLVEIITGSGKYLGSAPSGKSKGRHEAHTISIEKSLKVLKRIKENFIGMNEEDYDVLDNLLVDLAGDNFEKIGSHLGFAMTSALMKSSFDNEPWKHFEEISFPYPIGNVMGGGVHGGNTDIQEFHIIPKRARNMEEAVKLNLKIYNRIKEYLKASGKFVGKNDENAWISDMDDMETLDYLSKISENFGVKLGVDMAASGLYKGKYYDYENLDERVNVGEYVDFVSDIVETYDLFYVEDPFHEEDFDSHRILKEKYPDKIICGDDLFVTNRERLEKGIEMGSCNSILIKPNQIGTIGSATDTAEFAMENDYLPVLSHRSGETNDWIIADLSLGLSPLIKTGVAGGERLVKLNRLLYLWDRMENPRMADL